MAGFEHRGESAFRKWPFMRALSKLVDRKRSWLREKRDAARERSLSRAEAQSRLDGLYARLCSPSEAAIGKKTAERLEAAFSQLPEDYRRVITLSRVVGMSHAEIAQEMSRDSGAVRVLHRALVRLRRLMHEQRSGGSYE
jgi:RNA polymerase sigma factor (sigma-70 family)